MVRYGGVLRPPTLSSSAAVKRAVESLRSTRRTLAKLAHPRAFALPSDPSTAAARATRNLSRLRLCYGLFLWVLLLAALAPRRRAALLFLMAASKLAVLVGVLLRAIPWCAAAIDRSLVAVFFAIAVLVELVIADALLHLLVSMAVGVPIVLVHAVFYRAEEDDATAAEDQILLSGKKESGDLELGSQ